MQTMRIVKANSRGQTDIGWLKSFHSFSFGDYYNPHEMGHGVLRVLNDDTVQGGGGFHPHGHRDMEIISYVLQGGLAHRDSTGGEGVIEPNDVQVMTAGSGVTHSEFNAHDDAPVHFLQLWLLPQAKGLTPRYAQQRYAEVQGWQELASIKPTQGGIELLANASLWRARPDEAGQIAAFETQQGGWMHITRGSVTLPDGTPLHAGDALALAEGFTPVLQANPEAEVLLIREGY